MEGAGPSCEISVDHNAPLGEGSFGTVVYKGTYNSSDVAVKVFPFIKNDSDTLARELGALHSMSSNKGHENVVKFFAISSNKYIMMALELCKCNLEFYIDNDYKKCEVIVICRQLLEGLAYLHDNDIIHGDLTPTNILLLAGTDGVQIKISDFGMSRVMPNRWNAVAKSSSGIGTTEWMPPEVLAKVQRFEKTRQRGVNIHINTDFRTDIFSAGCLLYFIVSQGTHLFGDVFFREANILKGLRAFQTLEVSDDFKSLLYDVYYMTHKDPDRRPAIQDVLTRCSFWDVQKTRDFLFKVLNLFEISEDLEVHIDKLKQDLERYDQLTSAGPVPFFKSSIKSNRSGIEFTKAIILEKLEDGMKESPDATEIHGNWLGRRFSIFHLFLWEAIYHNRRNPLVSKYYKFATDPFPDEVISIFEETISTTANIVSPDTNLEAATKSENACRSPSANASSSYHYPIYDRLFAITQTPPRSPKSNASTAPISENFLQNPMLSDISTYMLRDIFDDIALYPEFISNSSVATIQPAQGSVASCATTALTSGTSQSILGPNEQGSSQTHYFDGLDLDELLSLPQSPVTTHQSDITDGSVIQVHNLISQPTGSNCPETKPVNVSNYAAYRVGMENWQRDYIRDNKFALMKTICCDDVLLNDGLYKFGVLSHSELKMLTAKRSSEGQYETTKHLLDTLVMKAGAYQQLAKFLYYCKQNRPFLIFLRGVQLNILNESPFEYCGISPHEADKRALLSSVAIFQGASFPLKDICKPLDESCLQRLLTDTLDATLYEKFLTKKPITIAIDTIPRQLPYYIPRTLSIRSQLDPNVFERLDDDVFCIEGITLHQLSTLVNSGSYTISRTANQTTARSRNQIHRLTARFILLESHHHFTDIAKKTIKMIHWIEHENGNFFYHKSNRPIGVNSIQEFLMDQNQIMLSEEELIEMCLDVPTISPILISGSAGMGKSVLLTELARHLKRQRPENLMVFLQLPALIRDIDCSEIVPTSACVKQTVAKLITTNKLGRAVVENLLDADSHRLCLFLDAYDEVPGKHLDLANTVLDCMLRELTSVRMFITTRPHNQKELEEKLGVLSYSILPFEDYSKTKFFLDYWRTQHKIQITQKTKAFAEQCLKSIPSGILNEQCDIAGIPVHCKMLADTFVQDAIRGGPTSTDLNFNSIHTMCKRFMNMKFSAFGAETEKTLRDFHVKEAFRMLFSKQVEFEVALTSGSCGVPDNDMIYRIGILEPLQSCPSEMKFLHVTFAEFLVAEHVTSAGSYGFPRSDQQVKEIVDLFFGSCLATIKETANISTMSLFTITPITNHCFSSPVVAQFINVFLADGNSIRKDSKSFKLVLRDSKYYNSQTLLELLCASLKANVVHLFKYLLDVYLDADANSGSSKHITFRKGTWNTQTITLVIDLRVRNEVKSLVGIAAKYSSAELLELSCEFVERYTGKRWNEYNYDDRKHPIRVSVERGQFQIFEYLLSFNNETFYNEPLLHWCIQFSFENSVNMLADKAQIIKMIINERPDLLNKRHPHFHYPPLLAFLPHFELIKCLIEAGADVMVNRYGENIGHTTAGHFSPDQYHELVTLLIAANANTIFKQRRRGGRTPVHLALENIELKTETLELLATQCGVDFNDNNNYECESVLDVAIRARRSQRVINDINRIFRHLNISPVLMESDYNSDTVSGSDCHDDGDNL